MYVRWLAARRPHSFLVGRETGKECSRNQRCFLMNRSGGIVWHSSNNVRGSADEWYPDVGAALACVHARMLARLCRHGEA